MHIPMGRAGEAEAIADVAAFFSSDRRRHCRRGTADIVTAGGCKRCDGPGARGR
jgi:hypothetical protein